MLTNDQDESDERKQDRQLMTKLKKELRSKQEDLYSSLPSKRFSRKMKDKPMKSDESL